MTVCIVLYTIRRLFMHDQAREEAMYSTRIVVDIIECLNHRNAAVRAKAALMCELGEWTHDFGALVCYIIRIKTYTCADNAFC